MLAVIVGVNTIIETASNDRGHLILYFERDFGCPRTSAQFAMQSMKQIIWVLNAFCRHSWMACKAVSSYIFAERVCSYFTCYPRQKALLKGIVDLRLVLSMNRVISVATPNIQRKGRRRVMVEQSTIRGQFASAGLMCVSERSKRQTETTRRFR